MNELSWLKQHEKLILAVLIILAVLWLGSKWLDRSRDDALGKVAVATQQLDEQKKVNAQNAQQVQQVTAQFNSMVEALTQQNAALASKVTARNVTLKKQQTVDATLPLPDLAKRWQGIVGIPDGGIAATPTGVAVNDAAARDTVSVLEKVPVLEYDLADTKTIADNRQKEVDKAGTVITAMHTQLDGLEKQMVDQDKVCTTQIDLVKADARKSKRNYFVAGFVAGIATRFFVKW